MEEMRHAVFNQVSKGQRIVGIGPMSPNCVEAIYKYSHDHACVIELIASRRQIETKNLGNGYVNNWTTEQFGEHLASLRKKYPKQRVFVCRDHGGPWQGDGEAKLSFDEAVARAKTSYEADISSGFDLLHIDPSLDIDKKGSLERTLECAKDLLLHCHRFAKTKGKSINFEVGTEENVGRSTSNAVFEKSLVEIVDFCVREGIPKPICVVGQTGSLVKEMRQVGNLDVGTTKHLVATAKKHGVLLKEHNADYLTQYQLLERGLAGVPTMNVAPEFGVIESKAFVDLCMKNGKFDLVKEFLALSLSSGKWKKWIVDNKHVSDYDRGLISGHYVFATGQFQELKQELSSREFDALAKERLYGRIAFYCSASAASSNL